MFLTLVNNISAQIVSLSPEQCGHSIPYGEPIFCTANDSAFEYEFKFFTSDDTVIITSSRNNILVETYNGILQTDLAYRTIVRCRITENWGAYGDTCITKLIIDWFSEMQARYNIDESIPNRTDFGCMATNLDSVYIIPVVFHVIVPDYYNGENILEYLPPDKINEQLDIINKFFAGGMADVGERFSDARMHFCFAKKDNNDSIIKVEYNGATYYGITYQSHNEKINVSENETYPELQDNEFDACSYYSLFPRKKYLNIFVFDNMTNQYHYGEGGSTRALGEHVPFSHIKIRRDAVGTNDELQYVGKNLGYTAVHELGHFFGLKHTFPDVDGIADIDTQYVAPPTLRETEPNIHNVMNYVPDEYRRYFTPGQVCRMRETIERDFELDTLVHSPVATECAPTLPNIYSARIVSPIENIVCGTNTIAVSIDDINLVKRISINGNSINLVDGNVTIDTIANRIEFQYTFDVIGFYEIEVSCGYDNNCSNWRTTAHKNIEVVECDMPTENLEQAQWYYDSYASLDFRDGLARFNDDSQMDAVGSESSICDSNGNLLFYTDGRRIWNAQHESLNSILADQVEDRNTIILKFTETKYAIISICGESGILYKCIISVDTISNTIEASNWSALSLGNDWTGLSVLSAVPTTEPNKYWLLTTKKNANEYNEYSYNRCVAKLSFNNNEIIVSNEYIDSVVFCNSIVRSIKVSPDAQYVLYNTECNGIKFYRFYTISGQMEYIENCTAVVGIKGSVAEFSASSNLLYVAYMSAVNEMTISQCDMKQLSPCECNVQQTDIFKWEDQNNGNFQAEINLQRAPDGRIYVGRYSTVYQNSRMIGAILNPEIRDSTNGRDNICGIRMHAIDYNDNRFLNRINFPNFVDVEEVDSCKVDFQVCGDWCPGDTAREIQITNLSNTRQNIWRFFDENDSLIVTTYSTYQIDNGRPDSSDYSAIYSHEFVTIELTSAECPSMVATRTIGRRNDVEPEISGPNYICMDEQPHSYHIINVPQTEFPIYVNWTSPDSILRNYDLHLTYSPDLVENDHIPIAAEIWTQTTSDCPYTVSRQVEVTEIDYVAEPFPYCNDANMGSVLFTVNNSQGTDSLSSYNFSDEYGNLHSNDSSFTVGSLPIGEYTFNITNEFCNYKDTVAIESALSDINISVIPNCEVDTIKLWKDDSTSLSGYVFRLNNLYEKTTDETMLTLVVSHYSGYAPIVVGSHCFIDITGPEPDTCTFSTEIYIPSLPEVELISHCYEETTAYVEIIIRNVVDWNLLSFDGQFDVNYDYTDTEGEFHYSISNISCDYMYNINNTLQIEYEGCVIYKGPIDRCALKISSEYKSICEIGGLTDIALSINYAVGGAATTSVSWYRNGTSLGTRPVMQISNSQSISYLTDVTAGSYDYAIGFGNCIREGTVEVVETEEPEYTIEIDNDTVCVNIVSMPTGTNRLVVHDAAGNELINDTIVYGHQYCFLNNGGYHADIITICDTFPVYFNVSNINVDLESEVCYKSTATISFEISGGTAQYTATFTSGSLTTTQTFSSSGQNVMYAEIMQGAANSLLVESADGHSFYIDLDPINYLSGITVLQSSMHNSYSNQTLMVSPNQPLSFSHDVTFTNCTIYCAYNDYNNINQTQWTVPLGKTVVFDSCTIKSGCPDKMWKGIMIEGNANSSQLSQRGKVLCNNTTFEDAMISLESKNGGMILANGCNFNNNKCDIYYGQYSYSHSHGSGNNIIPNIYNCTFSTTRLLNDNSIFPDAHICMNNVKGIQIGGCTFENTIPYSTSIVQEIGTPYYADCRGIGIMSTMSYFNTYSANNFKKLYYGVYVNGFYSRSVKVLDSFFTSNYRGIYINTNPGCKIKGNSISAYKGTVALLNHDNYVDFGAYIESCTAFTFEENIIANATTGLYVYNSGTSANRVRYNTFWGQPNQPGLQPIVLGRTATYNAIIVTGVNSDYIAGNNYTGGTGLEILCNNFQKNSNDIGIKDGYMRRYQGENNAPTGNQFLATDMNTSSHYQFRTQFTNAGNSTYNVYQYDYYQHDDDTTSNYVCELQQNHYSNRVIPRNTFIIYDPTYCQCNNGDGIFNPFPPVSDTLIIRILSRMQQLGTTLVAEKNELESKIDGGNTANALTKVQSISLASTPTVSDLSHNGYLSDTVYNALVDKIDENPTFVTSVLVENSPLPSETFEEVQDAEFSNILKTVLSYYQSGENARIADERVIENIKQRISHNENLLYNKAMNDSLATTDYNAILDYFTLKNDLDSKIKSCNILISMGNYDLACQIVLDIRSFGTTEALNFAEVIDMYISAMDTSMTKNMLKQKFNQLNDLIADNSPIYSGLAKTLYEYAFDTILPKYTPLFEDELFTKQASATDKNEPAPFIIYPNPTNNLINIEPYYNELNDDIVEFFKQYGMENVENCEKIQVDIYDITSHLIYSNSFNFSETISIDVQNYIPGTYVIEIKSCFKSVLQSKIIKI
ncbi:MAG: hypothetical protein IKP45_06685 [Bacteroidales bacterium]|nr:hypothetical protein [Bacteroidales bacterium]